ncbi:MAG: flagellar hook assembly protein FlgD [Burkholderiales bacterium]|nr:flagellar hook assembly protein FlgD [Burkholderiales bacterium]OJX09283.1 MAG: hypothetical protein BGO72_19650 [Burkholderiales bacterium 70-64]
MIDSTQNSTTNRTTSTGSSTSTSAATAVGETADGSEDRFLKLLVAQMRNQDPLNPLDNAQVTSQLAQIQTVRGIEQLNASMATLASASTTVSPLSAVSMLGRQVLVAGEDFQWTGAGSDAAKDDPTASAGTSTGSVRLGFELPTAARAVRVEVVDAAGRVVYSRDFDEPDAGVHTLDWDGLDGDGRAVSAGKYRLRAYGVDEDGGESQVTALVPARVSGVNQGSGGVRLELVGREAVPASAIRAVL